MTHRIIISEGAQQDFINIHRYLADEAGQDEADATVERLAERGGSLADFPDRGTLVDLPTDGVRVRSILVAPFRVFYEVTDETVTIFAILHTRRDTAALLDERRSR
ncbi:type II toxin-antitoxin system RelE/ParE family toxin [Sphingomonas sp.]|uniref:type II toxin-antitoxin system RelE/ParE family toxin n=1 Tax=Sphingomonas sp. TaxID=28214 RepID=UPI0035C7DDE4